MALINFYHIDQNYVGFNGSRDIITELRDKYSFYAKNYKWDKRFKMGYWDGKLSVLKLKENRMYAGMLDEIKRYLDEEGIEYDDTTRLVGKKSITSEQVLKFYQDIKGPFVPHDSQVDAFKACIDNGRNIVLAPTSNGKSYIIHGLNAYYTKRKFKTLIVINRSQLVLQLQENFVQEYGADYTVSTIYDENQDTDIVISTWQSLQNTDARWFEQFDVLIADEVHGFKAKSLVSLVDKCSHIAYRHGFTATLDNDSQTDAYALEGMFGRPIRTITLKEQIDQGISARPIVFVCMINYPVTDRRELVSDIKRIRAQAATEGRTVTEALPFQIEAKFLENHEGRNALIQKLVMSQKGNTFVAFKNQEHGKILLEKIKEVVTDKPIFFANGTVKKEKRFEMQKTIQGLKESVAVVSFGTFSTGVNITNLNNLIIASQLKSAITVPQMVGRMIRLTEGKTTANVIDICDDLSSGDSKNVFYRHFDERMKFYVKNGFDIRTKIVNL
jgi:superfamily II DNA or RNA helicase